MQEIPTLYIYLLFQISNNFQIAVRKSELLSLIIH